MLTSQDIDSAVQRVLAAAKSPKKIIVFGSYGRGDADEGSDLDLLVVESKLEQRLEEHVVLRGAIGRLAPGVGVDLLLCSEDEFNKRSQVPGTAFYWAKKEGRVAYESGC